MKNLYIKLEQDESPEALTFLLKTIVVACNEIATHINHGALFNVLGSLSEKNVQGETQKKLDVIANNILIESLKKNKQVRAIASEEEEEIILSNRAGKYLVCFDPLDGSSNTDVNGSLGTIFSITEAPCEQTEVTEEHFFSTGRSIIAAGYVLYGPSIMLALSTGSGTHIYTLNPINDTFMLTHPDLKIPEDTNEFSFNLSNQFKWPDNVHNYIVDLQKGSNGVRKKDFNMRWLGAMVGDMHRVLCRGGIFGYPSQKGFKNGKLRLLYEANPIAFLVEQANGLASNGAFSILDTVPSSIHQRTPVFIGSKNEVLLIEKYALKQ